jgi:calcineurin-like phosphoesterase family protein
MNEALITNWNSVVKPQDHVYDLGDVTMRRGGGIQQREFISIIRRLNGHKRLFLGNHDHFDVRVYLEAGYEKIFATWRDDKNIIYSHFPLHPSTLGSVRANVHGHIHEQNSPAPATWINKKNGQLHIAPYINVSCEKTNYTPISVEEIEVRIDLALEKFKADEAVRVGV